MCFNQRFDDFLKSIPEGLRPKDAVILLNYLDALKKLFTFFLIDKSTDNIIGPFITKLANIVKPFDDFVSTVTHNF